MVCPFDTTVTPSCADRPAVPARQHRRTFALLDEEPGNRRDDGCLAAAADAKIADAHDWLAEPPAARRIAAVPAATPRGGRAVEQARWVQSVNQSEGTNDAAARRRRRDLCDDGQGLFLGAAIRLDERPRRGAEPRAANRIRQQAQQRLVEMLGQTPAPPRRWPETCRRFP